MKVCQFCGEENQNDRLFCVHCNRYLPAPDPATQSLKPKPRKASIESGTATKPHKPPDIKPYTSDIPDPLNILKILFAIFIILVFVILAGVVISVL